MGLDGSTSPHPVISLSPHRLPQKGPHRCDGRAHRTGPTASYFFGGPSPGTMIIQWIPNLSLSMPKRGDQNVVVCGMTTSPPSDKPANILSASGIDGTERASEIPLKPPFSSQ